MYKKHAFISGAIALSFLTLASCDDDNKWGTVDNKDPEFAVTTEHIMTDTGRDVHFAGTITDPDGIASIQLWCPEMGVDKTIDLIDIYGEPQKEYKLDYKVRMRADMQGERFDMKITVVDVAGNKIEKTVLVTLDGDFDAPIFETSPDLEVTVLFKENPTFTLNFAVRDNRVIDKVEVNVEGIDGYPITIDGAGKNRLEYTQVLKLPTAIADYNVTITAYDKAAQEGEVRTSEVKSVVKVSELPNWGVIYLADVATAADLNSDVFGVPMAMDHVGDYKYRVRYYNEKAGTEICFIPQKTDFGPICFGPDPADPNKLGDDPNVVGRIKLDKAGVYYQIDVNTFERTYTLKDYAVSEALNPVSHFTYGGNFLNTWADWSVGDPWMQEWYFGPAGGPGEIKIRCEQDSKNPNIFVVNDWKLEAGKERFILHNWHSHGWWNYTTWRVDNSSDPSVCAYYGIHTRGNTPANDDWFDWKFKTSITPEEYNYMYPTAGAFDINKWDDEGYRKNFIGDNWIEADVKTAGSYKIIFDAHTERIKMIAK